MEGITTFTPEQLKELIRELRSPGGDIPGAPAGLGAAPPGSAGVGCGDGYMGSLSAGVYAMLAAGSPRLALAKAKGVKLAPYLINIRGTFDAVDTTDVPNVSNDKTKITQDLLIDAMVYRLQSGNTPADTFTTLSDFFFNFQSGIEATLDVMGAPRYAVAEDFTPLSTLADMINGNSHWPGGWILTYQNQLKMSFHANVALPSSVVPLDVIVTFRSWAPTTEEFVSMTNQEAFNQLAACGYQCSNEYMGRVCSGM